MALDYAVREAPAAVRFAKTMKHLIAEGAHRQPAPLPSYRQLAKTHGVGVRVVRDALEILEKEGLVCRMVRRGTFVLRSNAATVGGSNPRVLKCVNVVERLHGTVPLFVRTSYLRGYTAALEDCDIKMRFVRRPTDEKECASIFSDRYPPAEQGCILLNVVDPWLLCWLEEHKVPFVVQNYIVYSHEGLPNHHSIMVNKVGGGRAGTQYLIDLGHRRIGFVGRIPGPQHPELMAYEGYASAMRCAGLEWSPADLLHISTEDESAAIAPVRAFLTQRTPPTALLAENEAIAKATLRAADELQLRVPEDLSIVGFQNLVGEAVTRPSLTVVAVPTHAQGQAAIELLLAASEGKLKSFERRVLECHLLVGESTAPPRA